MNYGPDDKFCFECGSPLEIIDADYFDTETGEKAKIKVCSNLTCPMGCSEHGGHIYRSLLSSKCKRCGFNAADYGPA